MLHAFVPIGAAAEADIPEGMIGKVGDCVAEAESSELILYGRMLLKGLVKSGDDLISLKAFYEILGLINTERPILVEQFGRAYIALLLQDKLPVAIDDLALVKLIGKHTSISEERIQSAITFLEEHQAD
jgi:hypothetical protein